MIIHAQSWKMRSQQKKLVLPFYISISYRYISYISYLFYISVSTFTASFRIHVILYTSLFHIFLLHCLAKTSICFHYLFIWFVQWIQDKGAGEGTDLVPAGHSGNVYWKIRICFCINQYFSLICVSKLSV